MSNHPTPELLSALADGELTATQLASVNEHLAECLACATSALSFSLLKTATGKAGVLYRPSDQLQEKIAQTLRQAKADPNARAVTGIWRPTSLWGFAGWASAFAMMLILGLVLFFGYRSQRSEVASSEFDGLVTEACDQHVSTLAANVAPQVISSDRHTVKPWFQGKLPFSFNLPENLPGDTRLEGANLTYVHNEPAALLLYSIGKHRVSVFVRKTAGDKVSDKFSAEHSGFHVMGFRAGPLEMIAVSDVDPTRLSELVSALRQVQTTTPPHQE
jgi:anti-sigma factor RsiW